jgi:membrane protease YdiL (CAAX protease family)
MFQLVQHLLVVLAVAVIPVSVGLWILQLVRLVRGRPLLEAVPRRAVPWSLVDLLMIGLTGLVVLALSQWWSRRQFDLPPDGWELTELNPHQQINVVLFFAVSSLFTWVAALMICHWRAGATAADLGWDRPHWRHDVALGAATFTMLIVPVLLIHYLLQRLMPIDDSHPFVDLILENPRLEYLLPIALVALLAAPVVEEYFFRVLLQGWLERLTAALETPAELTDPTSPAISAPTADEIEPQQESRMDDVTEGVPLENAAERIVIQHGRAANGGETSVNDDNPYRSPADRERQGPESRADDPAGHPDGVAAEATRPRNGLPQQPTLRWLAIGISSLFFALAHFGQGPAPISLFVLALGLGYLYQRTHRVLPGMVVHFLVNLTAVTQLALTVAERQS